MGISATAKQSAKFDKYESKSEVLEYKAAADVTLKRKADEDEEEKPDVKRIKVDDVEAEGSKKKKRRRKRKRRRMEKGSNNLNKVSCISLCLESMWALLMFFSKNKCS